MGMTLANLGVAIVCAAANQMPRREITGLWCWCGKRFGDEWTTRWEEIIGCDTHPRLRHLNLPECGAMYIATGKYPSRRRTKTP